MIRYLSDMLKHLLFTCAILLFGMGQLLADHELGKKPKKKDKDKQIIELDSTMMDHIKQRSNQSDDTLVFEDWDDPDIGNGDNSAINDGGSEGQGELDGDQVNHLIGDVLAAHRAKKYRADFEIYPNPTVSVLQVRAKDTPDEIRIISLNGELIQRIEAASEIDVSGLSSGMYFIQMVYFDHIESKKFVKS